MNVSDAMRCLRNETDELKEAIEGGNMVDVLLECADVANFALIISAIVMDRGK